MVSYEDARNGVYPGASSLEPVQFLALMGGSSYQSPEVQSLVEVSVMREDLQRNTLVSGNPTGRGLKRQIFSSHSLSPSDFLLELLIGPNQLAARCSGSPLRVAFWCRRDMEKHQEDIQHSKCIYT